MAGVLGGEVLGDDEQQGDAGDDDGQLVELAGLGQRLLQPGQPGDLALFEDEAQEQHQQEHAAERGDLRVRVGEQRFVAGAAVGEVRGVVGRRVQRQVERLDRGEAGGDPHDDQREDQAHAEHGDDDADGEEDLLPELAHPFAARWR